MIKWRMQRFTTKAHVTTAMSFYGLFFTVTNQPIGIIMVAIKRSLVSVCVYHTLLKLKAGITAV